MIIYEQGDYGIGFIFKLEGSTLPKAAMFAVPSVVLCLTNRYIAGTSLINNWQVLSPSSAVVGFIWTVTFFTLSFLIGFRCNKAYSRFWDGCTLVQTMSAEWFESCSNLIAFSGMAIKRNPDDYQVDIKVKNFQFTLIRLMSLLHGVALRQIGGHDGCEFEVLDVYGLDDASLDYLTCDCSQFEINRAEVVLHWIQVLITESIDNGAVAVPAPILTRSYQTLSRGMVNLHRVRMIADIPFPFPLSQALIVLLLVQSVLTPLIVSFFFKNMIWSGLVAFVPLFGMWSLIFICGELENPFGQDANDLPLTMQQFDFNNSLLMLVDACANQVPSLLEEAAVEADDLRDTFGDLDSTTEVLYRCEQGIVTFRDFLRDNQQRSMEKASNVNEAMSRIKGDIAAASSDNDLQVLRNEARKRTNTRKATLKSNGSGSRGGHSGDIRKFEFGRASSKDLRFASREQFSRAGSRASDMNSSRGESKGPRSLSFGRSNEALPTGDTCDPEAGYTVDGVTHGSGLTLSRAGSMGSLASSLASLQKRKGDPVQGIPENGELQDSPASAAEQWKPHQETLTHDSLPLPEQNQDLLAQMQEAHRDALTKGKESAQKDARPESEGGGSRSGSRRNSGSAGAATDRSAAGSEGSGGSLGSSASRRRRMAEAQKGLGGLGALAPVPSGAELEVKSDKSSGGGSQGSRRSIPSSGQETPMPLDEFTGGRNNTRELASLSKGGTREGASFTELHIVVDASDPSRQVSVEALLQGGPQFPKQSWSAAPPRSWALAPMPPEHAPPAES